MRCLLEVVPDSVPGAIPHRGVRRSVAYLSRFCRSYALPEQCRTRSAADRLPANHAAHSVLTALKGVERGRLGVLHRVEALHPWPARRNPLDSSSGRM
jgi:hypothetical protein